MGILMQDLRHGFRALFKNPAFAIFAVLTLALGIGANTAIFSVMNAAVLRFLPVPNPEQLVYLHASDISGSQSGYGDTSLPLPVFESMRKRTDVFSDVLAFVPLSFSKTPVRFGATALLVAIGLYGTLAYRVSRRTAEIGVRMALGAQRGQVLWMVLRESLLVSGAGIAVGFPLAFVSARLMRHMLVGVSPGDAMTYLAAIVGVTLVALAASVIPAQRATRVNPIIALRYE